jgi:5-methylcytosine-specific restriction protein A
MVNFFEKKISKSNLGLAGMHDKYITIPKTKVDPIAFFGEPSKLITFYDKSLKSFFTFPYKKEKNGEYRLSKLSAYYYLKNAKFGDLVKVTKSESKYYIDIEKLLIQREQQIDYLYPDEEQEKSKDVHYEGSRTTISVNKYERNKKARDKCIKHWKAICSICNFEFIYKYGEIGTDFIHIHHLKPLSEIGEKYIIDPINDLKPVCPNCHSMIHKRNPPYTINEIQGMLIQ